MSRASFVSGVDAVDRWREDLLSGKPPVLYRVAESGPLANIELGPGRIALFGGAPGAGKTAFVMQSVFDALRLSPTLRAVVCNVEMNAGTLLDRQLSRLAGVPLDAIQSRQIGTNYADRVDFGLGTLEELAERVAFCRPPFDLANVAATADAFAPLGGTGGLLLVLDYIQRIAPPGSIGDKRGSVDEAMSYLRQFADAGAAVVVVSSVGRQRNKKGSSTYDANELNLASFKESGELEFGADVAFILGPTEQGVVLKHLKNRHGECRDIALRFEGRFQRFEAMANEQQGGGLSAGLRDLWNSTEPVRGEAWEG